MPYGELYVIAHQQLIFVVSALTGAHVNFLAECKKNPEERENFTLSV